jgi:hypothetical protein
MFFHGGCQFRDVAVFELVTLACAFAQAAQDDAQLAGFDLQSRSLSGEPQLPGTISGLVTNNDGEPVAGASLCTEFKNEHGASSSCGSPETDQHGQFSMHVPLGEVGVYASKPEDG